MMGLERLIRGLYGAQPQLDMDRQFARSRIPKPMELDFAKLAAGIKRNNVGTAGILLDAVSEVKDGKVVLHPTGQAFPLAGAPPSDPKTVKRRHRVLDWENPSATRLEIVPDALPTPSPLK